MGQEIAMCNEKRNSLYTQGISVQEGNYNNEK